MAIPIVAVLFGIGLVLFIAVGQGPVGLAVRRCRRPRARGGAHRAVREAASSSGRRNACAAGGVHVRLRGSRRRRLSGTRDRRRELRRSRVRRPSSPTTPAAGRSRRSSSLRRSARGSRAGQATSRSTSMPASISTRPSPLSPRRGSRPRARPARTIPLQAADDGVREFAPHEIVFVTKAGTGTDWVERGVVETATTRYSVPVTHRELSSG